MGTRNIHCISVFLAFFTFLLAFILGWTTFKGEEYDMKKEDMYVYGLWTAIAFLCFTLAVIF